MLLRDDNGNITFCNMGCKQDSLWIEIVLMIYLAVLNRKSFPKNVLKNHPWCLIMVSQFSCLSLKFQMTLKFPNQIFWIGYWTFISSSFWYCMLLKDLWLCTKVSMFVHFSNAVNLNQTIVWLITNTKP